MSKMADDCTPEKALEQFEKYQRETAEKRAKRERRAEERRVKKQRLLAEQGLEQLKGTALFFDMYHPLARLRSYDLQVRKAQCSATAFVQELAQGRFQGLSLCAPEPGPEGRQGAACPVAGRGEAPHFVVDPDVHALLLRGIPLTASVWDIYDFAVQRPGFAAIAWSDPLPGDMCRELRVRFETAEQADAALKAMKDAQLASGVSLDPELLSPSSDLVGLVTPPEMAHPDRIRKDQALSARIVRHLDQLAGVQPQETEALLNHEGSTVEKLDVQVLYLRRVHHFCFYGAAWCKDEWDLRQRCGNALLRDHAADSVTEGEWAQKHDQRLEHFLASAALDRPHVLGGDDEPISSKTDAVCSEQTHKISDGKFQCLECKKLFKGPEYVRKHLRKMHAELFEVIRQNAHADVACAAYLADSCRPNAPQLHVAFS